MIKLRITGLNKAKVKEVSINQLKFNKDALIAHLHS
jgi:hypothetical protein